MKPTIVLPPQDFLQECFSYNEETGELIWKERPRHHFKEEYAWRRFNTRSAGTEASVILYNNGSRTRVTSKRVKFTYQGVKLYPALHRIIFAMKGIEVPDGKFIDHKNCDPTDNRWENLRICTPSQNSQNKHNQRNKNVPKGVSTSKGKFRASVMVDGRQVRMYGFETEEEAHKVYCLVSKALHGDFHRPA